MTRGNHRITACVALALALVPAIGACGDNVEPPDPGAPAPLTYFRDIKPIVDAKCAVCHVEGGIAPMALETYDDVATHAGLIQFVVDEGVMPPWHANDECNEYFAARSLADADKAALLAWIEAGAPEGDPTGEGPPLEVETTTLSRVDSTLTMPEPYVPKSEPNQLDDYRCFIVPWPEVTQKFVTGFRARPGNAAVGHHAIAFIAPPEQVPLYTALDAAEDGPGWTCFGGPGGPAPEWVGAWVPGNDGADLAPGLGIPIRPGSLIILQMHYNTINVFGEQIAADVTELDFRLADQVDEPARILPWANPGWVMGTDPMMIPANDPDVMHVFSADPVDSPLLGPLAGADRLAIYNVGLHMHLLGTRAKLSIERADGSSSCLLQVDDWDFDWQTDYVLRDKHVLERGDELRLECHWDNSAANQPMVGGMPQLPRDVTWGEGSTDEMCLGIFLVSAE